jgi:hypothetical protein
MKILHQRYKKTNWLLPVLALLLLAGCKKVDDHRVQLYPDGPKAPIKFLDGLPSPSQGRAGTIVTFKVMGLKGKESKFKFLIGQLETEVMTVGDSSISVRIPTDAITGGASVVFDNQYFFGPEFRVRGNLLIDPSFVAFNGARGPILDIVEATNVTGSYIIAGSFSNYNSLSSPADPIHDIAKIDKTGTLTSSNKMLTRTGTEGGVIYSLTPLASGNYLAGGYFSKYNERGGIYSVTRLYQRAQLDTMTVELVNPDPINNPNDSRDTVATFNGGVNGSIFYAYETDDNQIIAVGNFTEYRSNFYKRSTKANKVFNRVLMNQVLKMNADGSLDSSFNYNLTLHKGNPGGNGPVVTAIRISGNRILVVGAFTTFNGQTANRIVCLDEWDGAISSDFNTGSGADNVIATVTYNEETDRILLTGNFHSFNGIAANGVVMLKPDGSVDQQFQLRSTTDGKVTYAAQLNSGDVIIAGNFQKYDDKVRPGFAYLGSDGKAITGYNNTGTFNGRIFKMIERTTDLGYPGVILVGDFNKFDNTDVNNIVYLEIRK